MTISPRRLWFAVLAFTLGTPRHGFAQAAAVITPPAAETDTHVPYPEGARGDAWVVLELEIDAEGTVSSAVVVAGAEPFAEQARRAALGWHFSPSRRGGIAVAARIRARIDFHDAAAAASSAQDAPPHGAPESIAAKLPRTASEGPVEITVQGVRPEAGETKLTAGDVREMPGAFGDSFRAIEALPGVAPLVSGLPYFYVRGAPPSDNLYSIDGVRVPMLFHVGIGEAVIHPALIDSVDFYPGSPPAAYGGTVGAVIAGQTRGPAAQTHGEANLRLLDAGALLEAPLEGGRGSALVAGRYGYPGPVLSAITSTIKLGYWDYQARASYRFGARDTLGLFAFGSHDYLGTAATKNGEVGPVVEQLGSDFHRLDLRYDRALDDGRVRAAATLGYDTLGGAGAGDNAAVTTVANLSGRARIELEQRWSKAVLFRGGAELQLERYRFTEGAPSADPSGQPAPQVPSSADPPPTNLTAGVHADFVWRLSPRVEVVSGVRVDRYESVRDAGSSASQSMTAPAIEPRLAVRVSLARGVTWLSALGLSHQYPVLRIGAIPALLATVPGFPLGSSRLQSVARQSHGLELALPADLTLTTTAFLSKFWGLTDLTSNCLQIMPAITPPAMGMPPPPSPYYCPSNQPGHGYAYGVELLLRRALTKRFSGWLSYTLSRSVREQHFVTSSGGDTVATAPSDSDRTHVLNAVLTYDLGRRWRAGTRFVFLSGTPYSNLAGNVPVPPYNGYRDPSFFRVDLRCEKRWPLGADGYWAFIAEIQNATLSKEVTPLGLSCIGTESPTGGTNQCKHSAIGPLTLPSVGVEASF